MFKKKHQLDMVFRIDIRWNEIKGPQRFIHQGSLAPLKGYFTGKPS